ncbi:MAG: nicotinate-nucleotide adenylyltransferase [Bacteroidetes bacterium]|nr:nicotinate-nucleotide adenylyltransferase [Bacteroidota bacterium]
MKIGLLFGSFNPIHTGHLIIANYIANFYTDEVWFVISPQNPFKNSYELLDAEKRLELTELATQNDKRFKVCDIEFRLPRPSYTFNTVCELYKIYKEADFQIVIGSDNLQTISKWKSSEELISKNKFLVYERPGSPIDNKLLHPNFTVTNTELIDISATTIRKLIIQNKSIRYLTPEPVRLRIEEKNYYK